MSPKRVTQLQVLAYAVVATGGVLALSDTDLGFIALPLTFSAGALAMALAFFYTKPAATPTVDNFRNMRPTDVINAAHIRVAGVGGLGMVFIAALMALQFPRVGTTVFVGLGGGIPLAFYLFRRHRQQRNHDVLTNGPGGRSVFPVASDATGPVVASRAASGKPGESSPGAGHFLGEPASRVLARATVS